MQLLILKDFVKWPSQEAGPSCAPANTQQNVKGSAGAGTSGELDGDGVQSESLKGLRRVVLKDTNESSVSVWDVGFHMTLNEVEFVGKRAKGKKILEPKEQGGEGTQAQPVPNQSAGINVRVRVNGEGRAWERID